MEKFDMLIEPLRAVLAQVGAFLPRLALAVVVLIGGWLLAKVARFTIVKALRAINFNVLTERAGVDGFLEQGGIRTDMTGIFGALVYWLVILAALIIAFQGLGLTYITDLLHKVVLFVPHVVVALLLLAFGAYFARFIATTVSNYCRNIGVGPGDAELLARVAQYAIIAFVVLIALDQLGVGGAIVRDSFLIILAGVVFALALAFGLGGRDWAASLLERWWPRRRREEERSARYEK
jgi:Mechanosensitive ion channel, conserved TM helix